MSKFLQTTHRDIIWFKQAHDQFQLEMKPPFQRNPVWTTRQKSFLIDTILNGYPIPEIYMQDIIFSDGTKKYTVVDGQQRITACLEFITGQFSLDSKDSPSLADLSFDDLTPLQKKDLYGYQFVIRILPEASDAELREIFQRLNRNNVALNQQELRQATYWGPFLQLMNDLADLESWAKLNVFTPNDVKRMLDVEFISELSIAVLHGLQNKKLSLDKYYEAYEDDFPDKQKLKEVFDSVLLELTHIIPAISPSRWSKKTDFYTLFIYLAKKKDVFPLSKIKREELCKKLVSFGTDIDASVSVEKLVGLNAQESENVTQYSLNLRASSDLGARKKREEALDKELSYIFESLDASQISLF